ncbi:MAG: hypothetical protein AAF737_10225 [Pseudomonadota bacterium]
MTTTNDSNMLDLMTEGNARSKQDSSALSAAGPEADNRPDSGETTIHSLVFWGARIGMTVWFAVSVALGLAGFSYVSCVPMVAAGTLLYQGFNGLPRPWMNEATLRIVFYSAVGMSIVYFFFFGFGRLVRWLFV